VGKMNIKKIDLNPVTFFSKVLATVCTESPAGGQKWTIELNQSRSKATASELTPKY
jgi:hypothetical protein